MALDAKAINGIPLEPKGMNDNAPIESQPNWYQTRGVCSIAEQCLQRCNGKLLIHKFDSPVLNIHGDLRGVVFIETATKLYIFDHLLDVIPT